MKLWYAVQEKREDPWDYGSDNYEAALDMLLDVVAETGRGLIAVIDEDTKTCIEEKEWVIPYDDLDAIIPEV